MIWGKDGIKWFGDFFDNIPIPIVEESIIVKFEKKVNKIIELKKANPQADTTSLETEIDKMVYELYELTEEEIGIIEDSVM